MINDFWSNIEMSKETLKAVISSPKLQVCMPGKVGTPSIMKIQFWKVLLPQCSKGTAISLDHNTDYKQDCSQVA